MGITGKLSFLQQPLPKHCHIQLALIVFFCLCSVIHMYLSSHELILKHDKYLLFGIVSKDINWSIYHLPELVHPRMEEENVIFLVYEVKKITQLSTSDC